MKSSKKHTNEPKKIGFFMAPLLTVGAGAGKYFIEVAEDFAKRGVEVEVVTLDEDFFLVLGRLLRLFYRFDFKGEVTDIKQEKSSAIKKMLGGARWKKVSLKNLGKTLKKYDVVYSKNEILELGILKSLGYANLPPVIVGVHTPISYPVAKTFHERLHNFLYVGPIYGWLLAGCRLVHLSNSFTKKLVDTTYDVVTKFVYYPFSVGDMLKQAKKTKSAFRRKRSKIHFVFLARMTQQKGVESLVRILDALSGHEKIANKIEVSLFGNGNLDYMVRELAERRSYVTYYGYVAHEKVPHILSKNDFLITTAKWETLPFNVLEPQSMGLPVIAFDIPGPNDIIKNGKTGFLVKTEEEFCAKMIEVVNNPKMFKSAVIKKHIKDTFGADKIYQKLFDMFLECIEND
jgi:glycosyltransferase involved in cell wall biosynthesis